MAAVLAMFVRLVTYSNAPDRQSAAAAIRALQAGAGGVLYLDGGWQSLIDDLAADLSIQHRRVDAIEGAPGARRVVTQDGITHARAVVVAAGPAVARGLIGSDWAGQPVRAACLTLALARPPPVRFALGYTDPVYFAVPSQTARQAPDGASVVQVARYLAPGEAPPPVAEQVFADHHRWVWGLGYRMLGVAADADDLVQDTFARALTRPPADQSRSQR